MRRPWLIPLTPLYAAGVALRNLRIQKGWEPVQRLRWPVVSIGNLSTGGAGKTPLAIALAKALIQRGFQVDVLSRGYGRRSRLPARVLPDGSAEDFGDEPLLIAREAGVPVYVARQRYQAGQLAEANAHPEARFLETTAHPDAPFLETTAHPEASCPIHSRSLRMGGKPHTASAAEEHEPIVHLLDDGFQHLQLHRDVDILLLNREDWADSLLPAGNLREPLKAACRASVIAIPADELELEAELKTWGWDGPIWRLRRTMELPAAAGPVAAFCGIARPEQFFAGIEAAGLTVSSRIAFPDHHRYSVADLNRLTTAARNAGAAAILTTEKDRVRLGKLASTFPEALPLKAVGLRTEIEDESAALDWLAGRLAVSSPHPSL